MPTIVFATNVNRRNIRALDLVGAEHRLLSYWYLKDTHPDFLKNYVLGLLEQPTDRPPKEYVRVRRIKVEE